MTRAISDLSKSRVSHRVGTTCVQLSDLSALIWAVLSHCLKQLGWKFFRLFFSVLSYMDIYDSRLLSAIKAR